MTILLLVALLGQDLKALAGDFHGKDRVLVLEVPPELDGWRFIIGWNTADGRSPAVWRVARAGRHCYEMRHIPEWRTVIKAVATNLPGVSGDVKAPTLSDEIDMFLEPERITPSTINSLMGHTLFGWSWNTVLMVILAVSTVCFAGLRKNRPFVISAGLGFLACLVVMDLRAAYDHGVIAYRMEQGRQGMIPIAPVKVFADRASEIIGPGPWGSDQISATIGVFLSYRLAEQPYIPSGSPDPPPFWISADPSKGQTLLQYEKDYFLLRRSRP